MKLNNFIPFNLFYNKKYDLILFDIVYYYYYHLIYHIILYIRNLRHITRLDGILLTAPTPPNGVVPPLGSGLAGSAVEINK
jgi:hypothetical protein